MILTALAILVTAVIAVTTISVWTPGCEDAEAKPTVLGGIQYELDNGVLKISIAESADDGYRRGDWPKEELWEDVIDSEEVTTLIIGDGISKLEAYLFYEWRNLKTIDLGSSSITNIPEWSFNDITGLERVVFPDVTSVTIKEFAFTVIFINGEGKVIYWGEQEASEGFAGETFLCLDKSEIPFKLVLEPSYTVTFDPDGGNWPDGSSQDLEKSYKYGTELDLSAIELPAKTSCTLKGWVGDDGISRNLEDKFNVYGNLRLTAVWEEKTEEFIVIFDPNGGNWSGSTEPQGYPIASGNAIEPTAVAPPTKDSCTFGGWSFDGKTYSSGEKVTVRSNMTFKAEWTESGESEPDVPVNPVTPTVPIAPIITVDGQETIEVLIDEDKESGNKKDVKSILLIAIVAAIIAELAVLSISKRR